MQDDISDGVKKLIADGIADPKRICIVGWSYGGYAALAGATLSPDLYACTIAGAGVSDLPLILATETREHGRDSTVLAYWNNFIGDRWSNADRLNAASPAKHAAAVKGPVMLIHGEDDYTVRINQSEAMEDALKAAGKKVTFIRIPKETHYLQSQSTRQIFLSEMEKFLKENIGN